MIIPRGIAKRLAWGRGFGQRGGCTAMPLSRGASAVNQAEQLYQDYLAKLKQLQESCPHVEGTEW